MPAMSIAPKMITLWPLAIPMKQRFRHGAAERSVATPFVVAVELTDGSMGYGETHVRSYVTGEREDEVADIVRAVFVPALLDFRASTFPEALEAIDGLPDRDGSGRRITGTRAAVELALLDAYSRSMRRSLDTLAGWLGDPALSASGGLDRVRYSGVISAETPAAVRRSIWKMRLYGLRDFKIKVGDAGDDERVQAAVKTLGGSLRRGRTTLRIDANGAWMPQAALQRLMAWSGAGITCVEQPLHPDFDPALAALAESSGWAIMADESLVTQSDAQRLSRRSGVSWFNIRLAKNGGLIPSIKIAIAARHAELQYQLGCLVGETSILSAAGRWFLQLVPGARFAEGSYGPFLLEGDVCQKPVRFGYGGRARPITGLGLGVAVDHDLLRKWCRGDRIAIPL